MNRIPVKCPLAAVVILGGVVWLQHRHAVRLRTERDLTNRIVRAAFGGEAHAGGFDHDGARLQDIAADTRRVQAVQGGRCHNHQASRGEN